ncbi:hypothetical protein JW848_03010, partial [Candidatus Bipolaricaulota bacterium]|nr:hypothetical protein [Candidatus Bipolaricaulota bacterium]
PPVPALLFDGPTFVDASGRWINARTRISLDILGGANDIDLWSCYRIDGGAWIRYAEPFGISGPDGEYEISYYVEDAYGNRSELLTVTVIVDNAPPELEGEDQSLPGTGQPCCPEDETMKDEVGSLTPPSSHAAPIVATNAESTKPAPETEPRVVVVVGGDSQSETESMSISEAAPSDPPGVNDVQTPSETVDAATGAVDENVQTASQQVEADG